MIIAKLALENGTVFSGRSFGADGEITGEVVFNTGMTGYQEILTDPSYCGQIVTMTYPLIGNYGVNAEDVESSRPQVSGFVVREYCNYPSNFRSTGTLGDWLRQRGIVAIEGIDTRMLTRLLREVGAMRGIISTTDLDDERLVAKAKASPGMAGLDLTRRVTCERSYSWDAVDQTPFALTPVDSPKQHTRLHVVVYDYGIKMNILRRLASYGARLTIVPSDFPAAQLLAMNPDGIFLSNGPGDPDAVKYAIANIRQLVGKKPMFGICLGHQLIALALGGKTFKLKFGHRGGNHPVKNLLTDEIEITSQNHGFAVDSGSLSPAEVEITHVNLNDGTNEGFRHRTLPLFSVQYHPEASPGPHDSDYLFRNFITMMAENPIPAVAGSIPASPAAKSS
jgi:carbamoyl-phosphate synthase small subunit